MIETYVITFTSSLQLNNLRDRKQEVQIEKIRTSLSLDFSLVRLRSICFSSVCER